MKPTHDAIRSRPVEVDLRALLYISDSRLVPACARPELQSIVDISQPNNASAGITGALMFTEENFVQYLEGPPAAVQALLVRLRADHRHGNLRILIDHSERKRRFGPWSLAYCGPPEFVRIDVDAALHSGAEGERAKVRLIDMMEAFSAAGR